MNNELNHFISAIAYRSPTLILSKLQATGMQVLPRAYVWIGLSSKIPVSSNIAVQSTKFAMFPKQLSSCCSTFAV